MTATESAATKFDHSRASEYAEQSRIALAGYDACHALVACMLSAALGSGKRAHVLVAGAGGTAQEIVDAGRLEPHWQFTAVDPSEPMLALAASSIAVAGLSHRTQVMQATVDALPQDATFDAATLIGVLHHLPGDAAKAQILDAIAARLMPGAPLVLACNRKAYDSEPLLLAAWGERWRMHGATPEEVAAKLGKIRQGAEPPASDDAVLRLLTNAGFERPLMFFSSLFWGAWIAFRRPVLQ